MDLGTDSRRLAIEIISNLVNIKSTMAEMILKPAGIPPTIYNRFLYMRDSASGKILSKRQFAPLLLDEIEKAGAIEKVLRSLIESASNWTSFHLADKEYSAGATVQKARELLGTIEVMEERENKQRENARKEELAKMEKERADIIIKQMNLLLMMFDEMAKNSDHHTRGFLLQDLTNRLFDLNDIPVIKAFTRNGGGEQIDGAFKLDGWHYIVECRWREKLANIRELDGLKGQVDRSGKQTMGLFLSINGWSENVVPLLKQNPTKFIILMDGYDLRVVLTGKVDLKEFFLAKIAKLNLEADPFYSVSEFIKDEDKE